MTSANSEPSSRLARRLGMFDAVVLGLGSMIGAGVFAAFAPAARAAGNGLLLGLALAAFVAYCNATSSASLAALYPESGGTYVYGRRRLGAFWGFIAGFGFVVGKLASCAAMALTFGSYAAPSVARPLAIAAVVLLTITNYFGVQKTVAMTKLIVFVVLTSLSLLVIAIWFGGAADPARLWPLSAPSVRGVLESAGYLFFAFAGYARIATLGEEVLDPKRTIVRAIPIALALTLAVYAAVAVSALAGAGSRELAASTAPLITAIEPGSFRSFAPLVRVGASIGSLGVLLSLIVGVSRTTFAMAANRDLPQPLAAVHAKYHVPHRAEIAVGVSVVCVISIADIRSAIGFSSFAVLVYYAIANAAAFTLEREHRKVPRIVSILGVLGCLTIGLTLPLTSVIGGAGMLTLGALMYALKRRAQK